MTALPSSLALTTIVDGSNIVAADHRNNYAAIQAAVNALVADLGAGVAGQVLGLTPGAISALYPPGYDFGSEVEFTSQASITATSEATATTLVTANPVTFDGSTSVYVEFCCAYLQTPSSANSSITVCVYDKIGSASAASIGLAFVGGTPASSATDNPIGTWRSNKLTPSAATHIFSMRAYVSTGTGFITAGTGGAGNFFPGFIRVIKA